MPTETSEVEGALPQGRLSHNSHTPLLPSAWYECGEGCWGAYAAPREKMTESHDPPEEALILG